MIRTRKTAIAVWLIVFGLILSSSTIAYAQGGGPANGLGNEQSFITQLIERQIIVSLYLVNGIRLQGAILSQDSRTLVVGGRVNRLVYKAAISTIAPSVNVNP